MTAEEALEAARTDSDATRKQIVKKRIPLVRSPNEHALLKTCALSWFGKHRAVIVERLGDQAVEQIDVLHRALLQADGRAVSRAKYLRTLSQLLVEYRDLRTRYAVELSNSSTPTSGDDLPPSFAPLVSDPVMRAILAKRWSECILCIGAGAPLAATVMMGGLLEALLLAKTLSAPDQPAVFRAKAAPRDDVGKTLKLNKWTLQNYIDVAHELGWISQTTRDVSAVLRDYRNYIHPQKQFSHGVDLAVADAAMFWGITKSIARQLLT